MDQIPASRNAVVYGRQAFLTADQRRATLCTEFCRSCPWNCDTRSVWPKTYLSACNQSRGQTRMPKPKKPRRECLRGHPGSNHPDIGMIIMFHSLTLTFVVRQVTLEHCSAIRPIQPGLNQIHTFCLPEPLLKPSLPIRRSMPTRQRTRNSIWHA